MDSNQELAKKLISNGHNLVLTGQEGTGKTYTIQSCYEQLRISGKRVQFTCYTGIACIADSIIHLWGVILKSARDSLRPPVVLEYYLNRMFVEIIYGYIIVLNKVCRISY
jgi:Cdc6-like AAA superfamily ATPase